MEKVFAARTFKGETNRWDESGLKSTRTTSLFPDKGYYAIVSPINKQVTAYSALDDHLVGGATVILSSKREGFVPGWKHTDVRFSLWIVCEGGKIFRLCSFESYQRFISRWSILYEKRHVIIEKVKLS